MALKTIMLGTAVAFALATPGFAQSNQSGPQYSTPAEHAQTQNLNDKATQGTTASPASLNGQGGDPNAPSARNVQYDAQMKEYEAKQRQYQDSQARYRDQQDRYRALHVQYERNLHRYDQRRYYFTDYPHAYAYNYDDSNLVWLYAVSDPVHQLTGVPVEGPNRNWVGRVRSVETTANGHIAHIEIALNQRVSVWVDPSDLRFDANDHVVFTHLSRADLWAMPGATYANRMTY